MTPPLPLAYALLVSRSNTKLTRTSVQVEQAQIAALRKQYPRLTKSEIIRAALAYLLEKGPLVAVKAMEFEENPSA